jgi:xanthine dehydrogenase large subunit
MLANSVWCALKDAIASIANYKIDPALPVPATPEKVYWAVCEAQRFAAQEQPL